MEIHPKIKYSTLIVWADSKFRHHCHRGRRTKEGARNENEWTPDSMLFNDDLVDMYGSFCRKKVGKEAKWKEKPREYRIERNLKR